MSTFLNTNSEADMGKSKSCDNNITVQGRLFMVMPSKLDKYVNKQNRSYSFVVRNAPQIDFNEIRNECLSRKNPLIFIVFDGMLLVLLHKSLLFKAEQIAIEFPKILHSTLIEDVWTCTNTQDNKRILIQWAKTVRKAQWPDEYSKEYHVHVAIPII